MRKKDRSGEKLGFTRRLARWLVKRYYPHIKITGADRIPQSGPVLLCANHLNSLLDPVLIGITAERPVRFLAKAPLFEHPVCGPPLRALGMIPAFRGSDDARDVRRNLESLGIGAKVLVQGHAMGIFPEGISTDQAHLEMVRSGAARMAIQACQEGAERVLVVPIGISYEHKDEFRSAAWIQVGDVIDAAALLEQEDGNLRKARRALTQQLQSHLRQVVIHLDEPKWEPWLDDLQTLAVAPAAAATEPVAPLEQRKQLADAMNYFLAHDRARAEALAADIERYRNQIRSAGLRIDSPVLRVRGLRVCAGLLASALRLALLFLPALLGTLHHLVPFVIVRGLAAKFDQPGRKTVSTNRMLVGLPLYLIWYGVVAWGMFASALPAWFVWTWLVAAPPCGVIAIHYWRRAAATARLLWLQLRVSLNRGTLNDLRQAQTKLRGQLDDFATEYAAHAASSDA